MISFLFHFCLGSLVVSTVGAGCTAGPRDDAARRRRQGDVVRDGSKAWRPQGPIPAPNSPSASVDREPDASGGGPAVKVNPEHSQEGVCHAAWRKRPDLGSRGDPFLVKRSNPHNWDLEVDIDGQLVQLRARDFVDFETRVDTGKYRSSVVSCHAPQSWEGSLWRLDLSVSREFAQIYRDEGWRVVQSRAGVMSRPLSQERPMVFLAWSLLPGSIEPALVADVRRALHVDEPLGLELRALPESVTDPRRPAWAVGFAKTQDPKDVSLWGVLGMAARHATHGGEPIEASFLPFGLASPSTSSEDLMGPSMHDLQNLSVWDATHQAPSRCQQVGGPWQGRCGNQLPLHVHSMLFSPDSRSVVFAHLLVHVSDRQLLLVSVEIGERGVTVLRTAPLDDSTEVGLPTWPILQQLD